MRFHIGDLVTECFGGPIMEIVGFVQATGEAICRALFGGMRRMICVALLILVTSSVTVGAGPGHGAEDPPETNIVEMPRHEPVAAASGHASGEMLFDFSQLRQPVSYPRPILQSGSAMPPPEQISGLLWLPAIL